MGLGLLALRNLRRRKRRTLMTVLGIGLGVAFIVFVGALLDGLEAWVVARSVEMSVGGMQVHAAGHFKHDEPLNKPVPVNAEFSARLLALDNVVAVSPRLTFSAVLNNGTIATDVWVIAYDPAQEDSVCPDRKSLATAALTSDNTLLVNESLAQALELSTGSDATVLAASPKGRQNAVSFTVVGTMARNLPMLPKNVIAMRLDAAEALLDMAGLGTEYALRLSDLSRVEETVRRAQASLGPSFEVASWRTRDPVADLAIKQNRDIVDIVYGVLLTLVALGTVNTMMMSVFERTREIGAMMAVGTRRRQILALFLQEAVVMSTLSAILGVIVGCLITWQVARSGMAFDVPDADTIVIFPILRVITLLKAFAIAVVCACLASVLPAWRAGLLRPIEALGNR